MPPRRRRFSFRTISRDRSPAGVAQAAVEAARTRHIPLLVDPKVPHVEYYAGSTVITPNHHEAEAVTHMRIRSAEDASRAAKRIRELVKVECVLITRGEHGMWLLDRETECELPAEAREVADVTGAGDTVISALALGLAAVPRSPTPPVWPTAPRESSSASSDPPRSRSPSLTGGRRTNPL